MRTLLALILLAGPVLAQQIGEPTTQQGVIPPRGTFAIRNARIVTVSGADIENGTVVIRDGKIEAVGANVSIPTGTQTIDGSGLSVYPGMIDAGTNMGLVEVPQGANGTVDTSEVGELNPNAKAIIAVNPYSAHIAVTRVEGITNTLTAPTGGLISGQAALINLLGTAPKEMAVVPQVARDQLSTRCRWWWRLRRVPTAAGKSFRHPRGKRAPGRADPQDVARR
jgi:hypothetical protein